MAYGKIKADTIVYDDSGSDVEVTTQSITSKANLASPTFTGTPAAPTAADGVNNTQIATTAFVSSGFALKASPTFSGTPAAPTASAGTNNTQIATTAYVDTSFAPKASPTFTGTVNAAALTLSGNLQVNGTTTTVASSTMTVTDKNIEIAKGAANDAAADGAGITVDSGDGDKTWNWVDATDAWTSSEHINLGDNKKFLAGTGTDLEIFHNGTNSRVANNTGELRVESDTIRFRDADDGDTYCNMIHDGTVELYHDNSKKIETTAAGVTVTGTVTDTKGDVRSIPVNTQSSAYVAVTADAGKVISISSGGVTLNANVFAAGDAVTIINNSGSDQTITKGGGVNLYNTADATDANRTLASRGMATVWWLTAGTAYISGAGLS